MTFSPKLSLTLTALITLGLSGTQVANAQQVDSFQILSTNNNSTAFVPAVGFTGAGVLRNGPFLFLDGTGGTTSGTDANGVKLVVAGTKDYN